MPKLSDGTLVPPLPQSGMGFPSGIPSPFADVGPVVTYTGLKTTRYHFDYGHRFYDTGIATINPPVIVPIEGVKLPDFPTTYQDNPANGPIYPSFVPKTDRDGNDIAGVRLADVTVPLATYTGWALRRGVHANDGCEAAGQFIPFAATEAERGTDPRVGGGPLPDVYRLPQEGAQGAERHGRGPAAALRGRDERGDAADHRWREPWRAARRRRGRPSAFAASGVRAEEGPWSSSWPPPRRR